jgi:hypothetical protein
MDEMDIGRLPGGAGVEIAPLSCTSAEAEKTLDIFLSRQACSTHPKGRTLMLAPEQDQADRRMIWDELQMFWMDTDPKIFLDSAARTCARSKYSLPEIERIFWNEVRPAVRLNLMSIAGEWRGFEIGWLSRQIQKTNRHGRSLPIQCFHPHSSFWWRKLSDEIERMRDQLKIRIVRGREI